MTQKTEILRFLKAGNPITPLDALNFFGCFRLAAVIFDLREEGHEIETEMVSNGNGKQFAEYTLSRVAATPQALLV